MKATDYVMKFSDGKLWMLENDEKGEYESEVTTFNIIDKLANAEKHHWCLQHKEPKQRRWRWSSIRALSLGALVDTAQSLLGLYPTATVRALTPDSIVEFIKE